MAILILFLFGCMNKVERESFKDKDSPIKSIDSSEMLIEKEYQRVRPICAKRGHIFTPCITEMYKLHENKYYQNTPYNISFNNLRPNLKLIDYPNRSELVRTEITEKLCYRCYNIITTTKEIVVKTVWKNS